MSAASASTPCRVALLGFGDFERSTLASNLRLSGARVPAYQQADVLEDAQFVIADADQAGVLDTVLAADRVSDTVFIGSLAPDGALAWMMRPIDPLQIFRELDATVALRHAQAQAVAAPAPHAAAVGASPAAAPPAAPEAPAPAPAPAAAEAPVTKRTTARRSDDVSAPTTALLVDASELTLRSLERQLQALGLRTETAPHSQRALELMASKHYDLVFLDVDLGPHSELDGLALCQQIKQQLRQPDPAAAPMVVMVSAHASATDRVRGSFAGCDAYLALPLDDETLHRSLRTLGLRRPAAADSYINSRPGMLHSLPLPLDQAR